MQVQPTGVLVNMVLESRLKIGGRWFGPGQVVAVDQSDFDILKLRGFVREAPADAKPLNVEKKEQPVVKPVEVVPPTVASSTEADAAASDADETTAATNDSKEAPNGTPSQSARKRR